MSYPATTDPPEEIALLPDWAAGVNVSFNFKSSTVPALSGFEQIVRHYSRCRNGIRQQRSTITVEENDDLSFGRIGSANQPVRFPLWGHGTPSSATQPNIDTITTEIGIPDLVEVGDRIVLWDPGTGIRWKTVATITNSRRTITFEADVGAPTYPAGSWLFPTNIGTLDLNDAWRSSVHPERSRESLSFVSL